jgi:hypothetical protein
VDAPHPLPDGPVVSFCFGYMFVGGATVKPDIHVIGQLLKQQAKFLVTSDLLDRDFSLVVLPEDNVKCLIHLFCLLPPHGYYSMELNGLINGSENRDSLCIHEIKTEYHIVESCLQLSRNRLISSCLTLEGVRQVVLPFKKAPISGPQIFVALVTSFTVTGQFLMWFI